jgi:hypothetical protein
LRSRSLPCPAGVRCQPSTYQTSSYTRIVNSYGKYNNAGEVKAAGHLRRRFIHDLRALGQIADLQQRTEIIGKLIYLAARLPVRSDAVDLMADILAYCPGAGDVQFTYSPLGEKPADIYTALREGVYLAPPPAPFDENPRLSRKYEIASWDSASLENLRFAVESRRLQAKI